VIADWLVPAWPAPSGVFAASLFRTGGVSPPPWRSLNLGEHVGDDPARVAANRERVTQALVLPAAPAWLEQVHGSEVLRLDDHELPAARRADAAVTTRPGRVLAVLTADCLPVLFCSANGQRIGIAHAGWRGLADGVLEATVAALAPPVSALLAWIGPGISGAAYEVGDEVRDACLAATPGAEVYFAASRPGHWHFDLAGLARHRLAVLGVGAIHGGEWCTFSDPARFFSHRRDGAHQQTGRMATLIWRE
jgi:polyphenol oxidase